MIFVMSLVRPTISFLYKYRTFASSVLHFPCSYSLLTCCHLFTFDCTLSSLVLFPLRLLFTCVCCHQSTNFWSQISEKLNALPRRNFQQYLVSDWLFSFTFRLFLWSVPRLSAHSEHALEHSPDTVTAEQGVMSIHHLLAALLWCFCLVTGILCACFIIFNFF